METWVPLVALIAGFVLSQTAEIVRDKRTANRETEAYRRQNEETRAQRSKDFQRENLLALQDALFDYGRAVGRVFHEDSIFAKTTGTWGRAQLSEEWSQKELEAGRAVRIAKVRTEDEGVRAQVEEILATCLRCTHGARTEAEAQEALTEALGIFEVLNERIGEILRESY